MKMEKNEVLHFLADPEYRAPDLPVIIFLSTVARLQNIQPPVPAPSFLIGPQLATPWAGQINER